MLSSSSEGWSRVDNLTSSFQLVEHGIQARNLLFLYNRVHICEDGYNTWITKLILNEFSIRVEELHLYHKVRKMDNNDYAKYTYVILSLSSMLKTRRSNIFVRDNNVPEIRTLKYQSQVDQVKYYLENWNYEPLVSEPANQIEARTIYLDHEGDNCTEQIVCMMQDKVEFDSHKIVNTIYCTPEYAHYFLCWFVSEAYKKYEQFNPNDFLILPHIPSLGDLEQISSITNCLRKWGINQLIVDLTSKEIDNLDLILERLLPCEVKYRIWVFTTKVQRGTESNRLYVERSYEVENWDSNLKILDIEDILDKLELANLSC